MFPTAVRRTVQKEKKMEEENSRETETVPVLVANDIAEVAGRQIRYDMVSLEERAAEAAEHGVPAEVVERLTYLFAEVVDGRNANTPDGVRRALGREPKDFRNHARGAAIGNWGAKR
jgi:hypothetical protein